MAQTLGNFVLNVAQNPGTAQMFKQDPHATMTVAGLSPEEINTVLTGNPVAIQQALVRGKVAAGDDPEIVIVVVL
jgi:hypothetical protein